MCRLRDSNNTESSITQHREYYLNGLKYQTNELWQNAPSWEAQLDLGQRYVRGLLPFHPSFHEPIWPETNAIRPGLLSLHSHGILTTYSEPGYFEAKRGHGLECAERKRPHLFFVLPTRHPSIDRGVLSNVLKRLGNNDSIWYHIKYHYSLEHVPASFRVFPEYSDLVLTNLPQEWRKRFVSEQCMTDSKWETQSLQYFPTKSVGHHGHVNPGCGGLNDYDRPFRASLAVDPLQICIVAKAFTAPDTKEQDLQTLVLELLDDAGWKPLARPPAPAPAQEFDESTVESGASLRNEAGEELFLGGLDDILEGWAKEALDKQLNNGV